MIEGSFHATDNIQVQGNVEHGCFEAGGAPSIAHYGPAKYYEALLNLDAATLPKCIPGKKAGLSLFNHCAVDVD